MLLVLRHPNKRPTVPATTSAHKHTVRGRHPTMQG